MNKEIKCLSLRPELDEYFLKVAKVVAQRSTCLRHNVGAVLVKDKQIISTGYNGAAAGLPNCLDIGCLKDQLKIVSGTGHDSCRAVHAEQNAIVQAALHGVATKGTTIYLTHAPCSLCTKMMINAGVKRVVCFRDYPDQNSKELLKQAGIEFEVHLEPELEMGDIGERVLVIERSHFDKIGAFEGVRTEGIENYYDDILRGVKYVFRDIAESDLMKKQIIPQFLVRYKDEYYISKRLTKSDEPRLRDCYYIAFGGHINPVDSSEKTGDVIEKSINREMAEELDIDVKNRKLVALVNDETMEVSRYHLGLIYLVELKERKAGVKEDEVLEGVWVNKKDLGKYFEDGDSWSCYIWNDLIKNNKI